MKKLAGLIVVASLFAVGTSVFATPGDSYTAQYNSTNNKVTIDDDLIEDYSTVLIRDESNNIVYIDQNDSNFSASIDFLLKGDPATGYYKVQLGTDSSADPNPGIMYFYIGKITTAEVPMDFLEKIVVEGYETRMGWSVTEQSIEGLYSLKIDINDNGTHRIAGYGLKEAFGLEGSGTLSAGFQLDGVPHALADESLVSVYLSPDKVSNFRSSN